MTNDETDREIRVRDMRRALETGQVSIKAWTKIVTKLDDKDLLEVREATASAKSTRPVAAATMFRMARVLDAELERRELR